jgi:hypothetical protein
LVNSWLNWVEPFGLRLSLGILIFFLYRVEMQVCNAFISGSAIICLPDDEKALT